jgi:hypothetical protein
MIDELIAYSLIPHTKEIINFFAILTVKELVLETGAFTFRDCLVSCWLLRKVDDSGLRLP